MLVVSALPRVAKFGTRNEHMMVFMTTQDHALNYALALAVRILGW